MTYAFRLTPGLDLKLEIEKYVNEHSIKAGVIISGVGSLSRATIRLADKLEIRNYDQTFEIVSLIGTVSIDGCHLHISLSDDQGSVIGGHLKEGCLIHTTAEIVITPLEQTVFTREVDQSTGFKELVIKT